MLNIDVIFKWKSRLSLAFGAAVAIYCAIMMKIMFMKLNNWFIHTKKNHSQQVENKSEWIF